MKLDHTHRPELRSWVESANVAHNDFPIQNLPFGMYRPKGATMPPQPGVAIGDQILRLDCVASYKDLNELAAKGRRTWKALRNELSGALSQSRYAKRLAKHLTPMRKAELFLPVSIGDYSDFFAGINHATNMGHILRPGGDPLLPNYKWVPIAYHGRASSIVVSGTPVRRPNGQTKQPEALSPTFGASKRLDYEVELGFVVGPGNQLGRPIPIENASEHVFGVVLLNDWSARDIQAWEYQPLGPFLAKSFASTISPWIVTLEALAPFRCPAYPRAPADPRVLPYLLDESDQRAGGMSIQLEMHLRSAKMRAQNVPSHLLSRSNFTDSYWTVAQMVAHHTSNGCNLNAGDLIGSGTISGSVGGACGSLFELTRGKNPITLPTGEARLFIEDGDEAVLRGRCTHEGYAPIGFGEATGRVRPALRAGRADREDSPVTRSAAPAAMEG